MSAFWTYTALRLVLLGSCLGIFYVLGARSWLLLLLAAGVSMALSYLFLYSQRRRLVDQLQARAEQKANQDSGAVAAEINRGVDEKAEDALLDAVESQSAATNQQSAQLQVASSTPIGSTQSDSQAKK